MLHVNLGRLIGAFSTDIDGHMRIGQLSRDALKAPLLVRPVYLRTKAKQQRGKPVDLQHVLRGQNGRKCLEKPRGGVDADRKVLIEHLCACEKCASDALQGTDESASARARTALNRLTSTISSGSMPA